VEPPVYRITTAENLDREGVRYWHVVWTERGGGDEVASLYLEGTYLDEIAPRLATGWTLNDIRALP
jgi:hypothetical protein